MPTAEKVCCISAELHVFKTNDTVLVQALIDALVIVEQRFVHAAATVIAVKEIFRWTDSADAALVTMEHPLFLPFVIVKGANVTEVRGKVFVALSAGSTFLLLIATSQTLDVCHSMPIQLMILLWVKFVFVVDLIMAKPACVECPFTYGIRTLELTPTKVMLTAIITCAWL